jgi:mono/diheme cytochrome c family protein
LLNNQTAVTNSRTNQRNTTAGSALRFAFIFAILPLSFGCWEQVDDGEWFPQMKRQITVQAFEYNTHTQLPEGQNQNFSPPEGTVPVGWGAVPDLSIMTAAEQDQITNPVPATLESLKNGEVLFHRYCETCHGPEGLGNGPLAGPPFGSGGPFGMVLPVGGPTSMAKLFSDGHIYTTISIGRGRMPNYKRIPPNGRWDLVNFLRDLNGQGGRS